MQLGTGPGNYHGQRSVSTPTPHRYRWLVGDAVVPVAFLLIRRAELARAVAASLPRQAPAPAPTD